MVLAEDGKKMSKRLKNYPDPIEIINKNGSDVLRFYLLSSPVVRSEPLRFKESGVEEVTKSVLIPLENSLKFLTEYTTKLELELDNFEKIYFNEIDSDDLFDQWIIYKLNCLKTSLINDLDSYILNHLKGHILKFIEDLNNTYIAFNRDRLKGKSGFENQIKSLSTLSKILFDLGILFTSFLPFFSEHIFNSLGDLDRTCNKVSLISKQYLLTESIHLLSYSDMISTVNMLDTTQFNKLDATFKVIDMMRLLRGKEDMSRKMPIKEIMVCSENNCFKDQVKEFEKYILSESYVLNIRYENINDYFNKLITPNKGEIGKMFKQDSKNIVKEIENCSIEKLEDLLYKNIPIETLPDEINGDNKDKYFNIKIEYKEIEQYRTIVDDKDPICGIYANIEQDDETIMMYYSKLMASFVQKYRKELELKPWDKIITNYKTESDILIESYNQYKNEIESTLINPTYINKDGLEREIYGRINEKIDNKDIEIEVYKFN